MMNCKKYVLPNGLRVLIHEDSLSATVVVNVLYDVGARDEDPSKTGLAHLVEHLMFTGSIHIPCYDDPLQNAGGENNAYTTNDITNYYCQVPYQNIETALWLESDRMIGLALQQQSIEVQKKVVCEEFKEHYIDKPYGDAWAILRALSYEQHPYRWMTIGKEIAHIENVTKQDIEKFLHQYYTPNNAILCVAGNVNSERLMPLIEKWFLPIPNKPKPIRKLPQEPLQNGIQRKEVHAHVPLQALYMTWHIGDRLSPDYQIFDMITEILGGGKTSFLYQKLIKEQRLFSTIDCYHLDSVDNGLITISGTVLEGISIQQAEKEVWQVIDQLLQEPIPIETIKKIVNQTTSIIAFDNLALVNRAGNLSFYELLGDANMLNQELSKYQSITPQRIQQVAHRIFTESNAHVLYYLPN